MNTQNTKKSLRLNFFDILVIILVLLVIAGAAVLVAYSGSKSSDGITTIEYTVLVKELPEEMKIKAEAGQTVVDTIRLGTIGEVVSFETAKAVYDGFDYNNEVTVHGEYDDLISASFTFRADAQKTESSYLIDGVRVSVGAEVHFRTPSFIGFGYVTEVRELPAE